MSYRIVFTLSALLVAVLASACADKVSLKDGQVIEGTIAAETEAEVEIVLPSGERRQIPRDQVANIDRSPGPQATEGPKVPSRCKQVFRRRTSKPPEIKGLVERGLTWLVRHQDEDGKWRPSGFAERCKGGSPCADLGEEAYGVGITSLALLALTGYGATPDAPFLVMDEHLGEQTDLAASAGKALDWLAGQVQADGKIVEQWNRKSVFDQAFAAQALSEGYALTGSPRYRVAAQKTLDYLASLQVPDGGWGYPEVGYRGTFSPRTLVTVFSQYFGRLAGLDVAEEGIRRAVAAVEARTERKYAVTGVRSINEAGLPYQGGHITDSFPHHETLGPMSLFASKLVGRAPDKADVLALEKRLMTDIPVWDPDKRMVDYWYWCFAGLSVKHVGAEKAGSVWQKAVLAALKKGQDAGGTSCLHGSWSANSKAGCGRWGWAGGRVYSTAMAVLALEAPIRFTDLPRLEKLK